MLLHQLLSNEALMIDLAMSLCNFIIDHHILLPDLISHVIKMPVAPEIMLPLLHNTHYKQYMLIYPFGFRKHEICLRLEHAEVDLVVEEFSMVQVVNGYLHFACYRDTSLHVDFQDMLVIEALRIMMILFDSPAPVCMSINVDDPEYFEKFAHEIQKRVILYKK